MAEVGWEFTKVFKYDNSANAGSKYIDITNDMQTPASTAVPVIEATGDYLYLGNTQKFDLAVFYLGTVDGYKLYDVRMSSTIYQGIYTKYRKRFRT